MTNDIAFLVEAYRCLNAKEAWLHCESTGVTFILHQDIDILYIDYCNRSSPWHVRTYVCGNHGCTYLKILSQFCLWYIKTGDCRLCKPVTPYMHSWWRHQMETISALPALSEGNSSVTDEFPSHKPVTRSFDVFFDLRLNKRLSKPSTRRWFETPFCSLWCYCN